MGSSRPAYQCLQCLLRSPGGSRRTFGSSARLFKADVVSSPPPPPRAPRHPARDEAVRPAETTVSAWPQAAPTPVVDSKHIRQNATLHEQNCLERNYRTQATYPSRIVVLHDEWQASQRRGRSLRERSNLLRRQLANPATTHDDQDADVASVKAMDRAALLAEARTLKGQLGDIEDEEARLTKEMAALALAMPHLSSAETPRGDEPLVLSYINDAGGGGGTRSSSPADSDAVWRSHVHIGAELGLLDLAGAATASGWGWYYLLDEGAQLAQALIAYALAAAGRTPGGVQVSPPSMVCGHIAAACGFPPRDQHGELQIYVFAQPPSSSSSYGGRRRPEQVLAGTSEIALAEMKADAQLEAADLPLKRFGVSRCYRAEAGARGADTKGLYRVHEFSKVELFAWTAPTEEAAADVFNEVLDLQTDILAGLGLRCRVLEMPTAALGASAARKCDIEAFFPSRRGRNDGWGELTSASICTDYQTRRLGTRVRTSDGRMTFPWTVNGTALAVPRVLAAILENGWDEADMTVTIPECLRPWMDGKEKIGPKHRLR